MRLQLLFQEMDLRSVFCSDNHDIILRLKGGGLQRISHLHPSYSSSLHYVVLFLRGEDGWHPDIPT